MPVEAQAATKNESTYGTPVTVDKFFEFNEESIDVEMGRLDATGMRTGAKGKRSDRRVVYTKGASGPLKFYVLSKGFGWWLQHLVGGTVTTSGPTDSAYTHTGAVNVAPRLTGKSFTAQINRKDNTLTDRVWTFEGGKVTKWGLACDAEGLLECTVECDFEDFKTNTALASATYPTAMEPFSFVGGSVTYNGVTLDILKFGVDCTDQGLDTERRLVRANALKKEPVEKQLPEFKWTAEIEQGDLTQWGFFASATAAGSGAQIVATFAAPTLIGVAAYPTLTVTLPFAGCDEYKVGNKAGLNHATVGGDVLWDGTNAPVTLAYKTLDATPL